MTPAGEKEALVAQRALKSIQPKEAGKASGCPSREAEMAAMRESGGPLRASEPERGAAKGKKREIDPKGANPSEKERGREDSRKENPRKGRGGGRSSRLENLQGILEGKGKKTARECSIVKEEKARNGRRKRGKMETRRWASSSEKAMGTRAATLAA